MTYNDLPQLLKLFYIYNHYHAETIICSCDLMDILEVPNLNVYYFDLNVENLSTQLAYVERLISENIDTIEGYLKECLKKLFLIDETTQYKFSGVLHSKTEPNVDLLIDELIRTFALYCDEETMEQYLIKCFTYLVSHNL